VWSADALVRCESVTPREAGALQHLERVLATLGFRCERMDFSQAGTDDVANLYARIGQDKDGNGRHFCFAGHSDVVPVGDLSSWTVGPFSAELSDGYLFGRGAADMKGAIAAFTEAVQRFIARRGRDFGGAISLLITGDEEGPAVNGTVKMLQRLAGRGETIDACVVGEPTSSALRRHDEDRPARQHDRRHGGARRAGPCRLPERLDNPIHRLSALIEALVREPIDKGSVFQPTSLQFTTVGVGKCKATNIAPGVVRARFNTRLTICQDTSKTCWCTSRSSSTEPMRRWAAMARSSFRPKSGESFYAARAAQRPGGGRHPGRDRR
jgi:succinyl-diaminopimelate desuccinylase